MPLMQVSDQTHQGLGKVTLQPKHDESRKMLGAEWTGKQSITVNERSVPMVTDPVCAAHWYCGVLGASNPELRDDASTLIILLFLC